ncbi:MAG: FGGY family carbohydrate kinase [Bacteroidota bacterium]|nr:FGGY family carbohydrate kinase [Bacteroidota bacterium]
MQVFPAIAIFDIGRTNKKLLLFDAQYRVVHEQSVQLPETEDEDGFPTEDLSLLTQWIRASFDEVATRKDIQLKAVNVSAYGASLVHLDKDLNPLTPLYSYLKPFPADLQLEFNHVYDSDGQLAKRTASPELGSLNSGMQLYRLKKQRPSLFRQIRYSLHLPQYISFLLSGQCASDLTSIGCHTRLWDFEKRDYHVWAGKEGLIEKFAGIAPGDSISIRQQDGIAVGLGLHDSSAALIPYLSAFEEPFVLLSTGTWSISLNPFNHSPLTDSELQQDCLCFLSFRGKPVKASRLFAGHHHEIYTRKLSEYFQCRNDYYLSVNPDPVIFEKWSQISNEGIEHACAFIDSFNSYDEAYHVGMMHLMNRQKKSTDLVLGSEPVKLMFVDGGFSKNPLFMRLAARAFPQMKVYAASLAQASALGAAQVIHHHWNTDARLDNLLELKHCAV